MASFSGFSKGWKETFSSGDQEVSYFVTNFILVFVNLLRSIKLFFFFFQPWVFRGGLTADLQVNIALPA